MDDTRPLFSTLSKNEENEALLREAHPQNWHNPPPADIYDLVVIGAGPVGIVAAKAAANGKNRVALIERDMLGGDCFNVGCISTKVLIRASRLYADMNNAGNFGSQKPGDISFNFPQLMKHMRNVRVRAGKHISVHRLREMGIDIFLGAASFTGPRSVVVDNLTLNFRKALVATGSRPRIPPIKGLSEIGYHTNKTIFNIEECPKSLLIIGGGPLGCEMAQAFCRLGTQVSIAQRDPMFLANVERDGAQILSSALARNGVGIYLNAKILDMRIEGNQKIIELLSDDIKSTITVENILVSAGRWANVEGLNLEKADVYYKPESGIEINDHLQTSNPDIYAAGDVCPAHIFDHVQDAAARAAVANALNGEQRTLSSLVTPWCIYTDPEVAHVGLHVREAREKGIAIKTYTVLMHQVDRAIADGEDEGFVKIHVKENTDEILGATIVARHAGDIISCLSLAMNAGLGLRALADASFPYPTQAQAVRMAAMSFMGFTKREMPLKDEHRKKGA